MRLNYRVQTDSHSGVSVCLSNEEDFLLNFRPWRETRAA